MVKQGRYFRVRKPNKPKPWKSYLSIQFVLRSFNSKQSLIMALALLISSPTFANTNLFSNNIPPKLSCKSITKRFRVQAIEEKTREKSESTQSSADEVTKKYGLEVGLWKIFTSKGEDGKTRSKTDEAKELLAKYGGAYLATSITLSLISFGLCYALVSAGIYVPGLLTKVGIVADEAGGKVGTFALAYAAHKAASPIRFPPTVALTPIVASWIGKKTEKKDE